MYTNSIQSVNLVMLNQLIIIFHRSHTKKTHYTIKSLQEILDNPSPLRRRKKMTDMKSDGLPS